LSIVFSPVEQMKQVRAASLRVNTKPRGFVVASW
jgi:hypothetical protein